MQGCEAARMRGCEDARMRGCEDARLLDLQLEKATWKGEVRACGRW